MKIHHYISEGDIIIEQINYSNKDISFYSWDEKTWDETHLENDTLRVAIFKPKGSTIKIQPNK